MSEARILRIFLDPVMLKMAREGSFGFVKKVKSAFEGRGFRVEFVEETEASLLASAGLEGYALFLMKDPFHPRALSMRKAYYYPYWRIEATARRWEFRVAGKRFDPDEIDTETAQDWFTRWRRNLFKKAPLVAAKTGEIYVALQGRLLDRRSFQSMSPVDMIAAVQARAGDRRIRLGLHPGETYRGEERAALDEIAAADPRVSVQTGGMVEALQVCDHVVTENSTAALSGFFFKKPAILFGETDFHHQMPRLSRLGARGAWSTVESTAPDYAKYLYWFIHLNAIKADTAEAETRILDTCRSHGWEV